MQTNPTAVGCSRELCSYNWLPETVHALTVGHREINLKLSWVFPPSNFIVLKGASQTIGLELSINNPALL